MEADIIALLTLVAMIAGTIDAIAGGGGLLTLPALMIAGLPPINAIATNKLQATAGSFSATAAFARRKLINWKKGGPIALLAFSGGMLGANLISQIPQEYLKAAAPILLLVIATYFIFSPKFTDVERKPKMPRLLFLFTFVPLIGFYDGVFGPGTGSFYIVAFVALQGHGLLSANAYTKLANFSCNLGSLLVFLFHGNAYFVIALCMAVGAFVGAQIGSRFAVRFGARLIKPLLIILSTIMAIKLLLDPTNPLIQLIRG
ncbi:TSUP family transporter [Ignatzschineria sp. RMDPL8A]|uniref:TSUP family transporter n=1 Tax=Ignatzschineria sp. RMDPL8A TaxID=2999236 RepID=UPI0024467542|nr:TSUP family transporter [Ignatzschineria sp. RMDPL8A]MDG9730155.1 TSUP family transporter [Ignatzschineria sp. RMDPL8A]